MLLKKNNWAYEKIGDISEKILAGGDKPKVFSEVMTNECYIPVYANGVYNNGLCGYTNMPIIKDECITISARGTIGFCCIRTTPFVPIVRLIVVVPKSSIANKFLCYAFRNLNIEKNGGTIPQLTVPMIKGYVIPIPSLSEQSRIVEELDLLSNIIEKKRQQLSELDNLAQSIFYDMFGDPVTNEKGWEVKPLKDNVYEMFLGPFGSALKVDSYVEKENAYCMVYEQKHAIQGTLDILTHYINKDKYDSLKRFAVKPGDFIMSCRGTIGKLYQLPIDAPLGIIHPSLMKIRIKDNIYHSLYFKYMLVKIVANESTNGNCVQMAITAKELGNRRLPLPPLSLQQLFAKKIEAIEKQKALIKQSIVETEELFNSRMDYYFS